MKKQLLYTALFVWSTAVLWGQESAASKDTSYWKRGAGFALAFDQLLNINPRQGAAQDRLGFGGGINVFGNYQKGRVAWSNLGQWNFGVQRLGIGVVRIGNTAANVPFQKSLDELVVTSKLGYKTNTNSKLFYAADFNFLSQLTPTFQGGSSFPGLFLSNVEGSSRLSQLFAPAIINLALGVDYKPNDKFSLFYSPLGAKWVIVSDDAIALRGVHGNPVTKSATGVILSAENVDAQLGSQLRMVYTNKFLDDKLAYTSNMLLFSNYLSNPQNIDLDWRNSLSWTLFKNFQLGLLVNFFYDDDMNMFTSDFNAINGIEARNGQPVTGPRLSVTQQLLLKYAVTF
jgi:hypothetical protein